MVNYDPLSVVKGNPSRRYINYEQLIPRWIEEAKAAHDWLVNYKNTHLVDAE